jgi:ferredoxin-nitrate reductase
VVDTPDRLARPHLRAPGTTEFRPAAWNEALAVAAEGFTALARTYGPEAIAFYGSGQLDTEAAYLACKLFKGSLGTNNTDSNSRLCMASAVAGYVTSLGSDGPPTCYEDIEHADLVLILGANMADAHPVTFDQVKAARKARPGVRVVVIDPRRTKTAEVADLHLAVRPGGDLALLNGVARALVAAGAVDGSFLARSVGGFDELAAFLAGLNPEEIAAAAGLTWAAIEELAGWIAASRAFLSFYSMGANQSSIGVQKNNALINLHLLTGQIGRPGAGPFSLTGQPNAMGGREAGILAQQLPGYRFVADTEHRAAVEGYWGRPPGTIAPAPGLTAVEMFRALERGTLKGIWIAATNPAVSMPDLHQVRRALERAELVVVQDCYHPTETTRYAHVLLPAAQWSEKEGTSTNSERMVAFSDQLVAPPGAAWPDWRILAAAGQAMGFGGFGFASAAEVWDEFRGLTRGRPCDMAGMPAARLRRERALQWPCPDEEHPGTRRRYEDGRFPTPDGRARLWAWPTADPALKEGTDAEFPLVLNTGRIASQWHSRTRTGKVAQLVRQEPEPFLEIHPADAVACGVADGDLALVASRRGCVRIRTRVTDRVRPGSVFAAFHWGDLFGPETAVNYLTLAALDPRSKQPELKGCAVTVQPLPAALAMDREPVVPWPRTVRWPAWVGRGR